MPFHRNLAATAVAIAFAAFLAACRDGSGLGQGALSQSQADSLAEQMVLEADAEIDGATASDGSGFALMAEGSLSMACVPTVAPLPVANTDGDRAPDSIRITFASCANTWPLFTDSISGNIDLIDPTPAVAGANIRSVFTNLRHKRLFTLSGLSNAVTLNGTRLASRTTSVLQHTVTNFSTDFVFRNGATANHTRTWSSTFTADAAGSIAFDAALPSGTWNIAGTSTWTRGSRTHQVTVTTNPPLHFNATCTTAPRFDAGTLTAVVTRGGNTTNVTVNFTACGTYTVTRS